MTLGGQELVVTLEIVETTFNLWLSAAEPRLGRCSTKSRRGFREIVIFPFLAWGFFVAIKGVSFGHVWAQKIISRKSEKIFL